MKGLLPILAAFIIGLLVGLTSYHLYTISKQPVPGSIPGNPPVISPNPGGENPDAGTPEPGEDEQVACTLDAKLCPDGSAVGRVPPNCEFSPCPGE